MSQVITPQVPSGSGLSVREGINAVMAALMSTNSGPSEPPNPVAGMAWFDTTANDIKIRNAANTVWLLLSDMIGALEYDRAQSLTAPQKAQALANIEALAYGQTQALTAAQAVRAWRNMGAIGLTGVASKFYFKLPDGTIIQTGTLPTGGVADQRVILPTVFPTFLLTAVATVVSDDAAAALTAHVSGFANDAFDVRRRAVFNGGGVQPNAGMTVNWIAIGY